MEEARAAQSQTVHRAKEAMTKQWKRTRSEQVSEHRALRARKKGGLCVCCMLK